MRRCPTCRRDYHDETLLYCLDDGAALLEGPGSFEPPTSVLPLERSEAPTRHQVTTTGETALLTSQTAGDLSQGKRRVIWILGLILALFVVGLAVIGYGGYRFYLSIQTPPPGPVPKNMTTQRITGDGKARGAEISPDGKFLAYIRTESAERSIWLKQIHTNSNIEIVKAGDLDRFDGIVFSPDGNFLYFNAQSSGGEPAVYKVPTLGGTPTKVLAKAYQVQFSPDGRQISFGRYDLPANEGAIYIANSDGGYWREALDLTLAAAARDGEQPDPVEVAILYAKLGDRDKVFEWLEKGFRDRRSGIVFLKVEPGFDGLRSDPRFADLQWRVGLPQ